MWGTKPRKMTPYHPPANGTMERFNQVLKQTILTAYAANLDRMEGVNKLVASYRNMPHSVTVQKPSKLMFNMEVDTKLSRIPSKSRGNYHKEARINDKKAIEEIKRRYDKKHRTRFVEINPGDWVYTKNMTKGSTRGPWEPIPFQITKVIHNRITGV